MDNTDNQTWTPPDKGCMPAHIKKWAKPQCPVVAVIPLVEVATPENIKKLSNCFVHVQSTNTTYYIDNQHKFIQTWAGPVFIDGYDYETNPLGLRGQFMTDVSNGRLIIYNNAGEYFEIESVEKFPVISDEDWAALWAEGE